MKKKIAKLDIHINNKVKKLTKNQIQKGTESRYSDAVYTVTKINDKSITLNNDEVYKRPSVLEGFRKPDQVLRFRF
jgi:hypothetical protein